MRIGSQRAVTTRDVASGASAPLGATVLPGGVNFSVFSKHAVLLELLLFDDENATRPRGSFLSVPINIAPFITGMPSCRALSRARCTPTGRTARSTRTAGFGLTPRRCSSTLTGSS